MEYRIARRLVRRRQQPQQLQQESTETLWADRLIAVLATTAGLVLLGSFLQELLWAMLAVATALSLAIGD
jgi:hypothetical protein